MNLIYFLWKHFLWNCHNKLILLILTNIYNWILIFNIIIYWWSIHCNIWIMKINCISIIIYSIFYKFSYYSLNYILIKLSKITCFIILINYFILFIFFFSLWIMHFTLKTIITNAISFFFFNIIFINLFKLHFIKFIFFLLQKWFLKFFLKLNCNWIFLLELRLLKSFYHLRIILLDLNKKK